MNKTRIIVESISQVPPKPSPRLVYKINFLESLHNITKNRNELPLIQDFPLLNLVVVRITCSEAKIKYSKSARYVI